MNVKEGGSEFNQLILYIVLSVFPFIYPFVEAPHVKKE